MSFSNLPSVCYDNRFKSTGSNFLRKIPKGNQTKSSLGKQLAREKIGGYQSTPAISNSNYQSLRTMHGHGDRDPYHNVRRSLTEAQEIGWWVKDVPLKTNDFWTKQKRYPYVQSEMTKFVNHTLSTDRSFRLFQY